MNISVFTLRENNSSVGFSTFDLSATEASSIALQKAVSPTMARHMKFDPTESTRWSKVSPFDGDTGLGYHFVQPLTVSERYIAEDDTWLVTDSVFNEYGVGRTIQEARRDYLSALVSYYETLAEWATDENVPTQKQFARLREYFVKGE